MKFPVPHDVSAKTIPGTEGWERMYPYQYQFVTDDPVRNQYEKETFWFYDGLHYPEPLYPFDTIWDEAWYLALSQFNNRIFQVPPVRGVDHRMINGYVYISPVAVKDGAEIGSRVPNFMERAGYYYKNWDALEAKWKVKMEATIKELEDLKIQGLPPDQELRRPDQPRHQVLAVPLRVPQPRLCSLCLLHGLHAEAVPQHPAAAHHADDLGHRRHHVQAG
jgi:pyruvate,water dikinase